MMGDAFDSATNVCGISGDTFVKLFVGSTVCARMQNGEPSYILGRSGIEMMTDLDITGKTALVFGTELTGLSPEAVEMADAYVKIPMYGFTESFNISVCAALSLFSLTERMRADGNLHWQMTDEELIDLKLEWASQVIRDGEAVMKNLMH